MKKVALVTGGAKGIGREIVRRLAKSGIDVVINYLTSEKEANDLLNEITSLYNIKALAIKADVSKEDEVDLMFKKIEEKIGNVNIVINNAAIDIPEFFKNQTVEDFKRTLDINVIGSYIVAKRAYNNIIDNKWGRVINISSTNGINTYYPVSLEYDSSKAALISLTHNLAIQFSPYATVNAIAPGFIGTENELNGYDKEMLEEETEKILVKRYGKPEEVASLVNYLVSDEAEFINNEVIRIDGGQYNS